MINIRSLRFRLAVWYFCTVAAILSLAATGYWFAIRAALDTARDEGLRYRLVGVRDYLVAASGQEGFALLRHSGEVYQVYDDAGRLLMKSARLKILDEVPMPPPPNVGESVTYETRGPGNFRVRIAWQRMTIGGHTFVVGAIDPARKYDGVLNAFTSFVFLSTPAIVLVAVVCGVWLGRRALAPVSRITEEARAITESNLSTRLAVPDSRDELEQLSKTLNEMLTRIEQSFSRTKQFTADASHELRAPMTLIYTAAQYAVRRPRRHEELVDTLHTICDESERTTKLIDDLLLLARGDAGRDGTMLETVDVRGVIQHAADQAVTMGMPKNLTVVADISPERLLGQVDETEFGRLLLILIDNAVKYTPSGGVITIAAQSDVASVTISVADTGVGIAAEDLPHIFERFWRADKVRSRDVSGAGLGLPIARQIADLHNAELDVWSEPGRGTRFTVRIARVLAADAVTVA